MIGKSLFKINHEEKILITPEVGSLSYFFFKFAKSKETLFSIFNEFLEGAYGDYTFVIDNSMEGWNVLGQIENDIKLDIIPMNPLDWIVEYIDVKKFKDNKIQIYTSDLNCKHNTGKYSHLFYPVIYFNDFIPPIDDVSKLHDRNILKKFIALNRRIAMRDYRTSLYIFLKLNNILDDCYYSFNSANAKHHYHSISLEGDLLNDESDFYKEDVSFYKTSFCNIVTETYFDNMYHIWNHDTMFLSEKIFKAINNCQPFIVFARHGYLKKLKELGFKTFDKWWDESYDDDTTSRGRINKLLLLIKKLSLFSVKELSDMYIEMIPILEHNFKLSMKYHIRGNHKSYPRHDDEIESSTFKKILNEQ